MRSVGLGLAIVASVQFVFAPTLAFARDPAPVSASGAASPSALSSSSSRAEATKSSAPLPPANAAINGKVTVHIASPRNVSLESRSGDRAAWAHVCNSPCDQSLSTTDEYRIVGADLSDSKPFRLDSSQGDKVTLDVTPGVRAKENAGKWILGGGIVCAVGGIVTIAAGSRNTAVAGNDGTITDHTNMDFISLGTALILVGVLGGIGGSALVIDNAHTRVEGAVGSTSTDKKSEPVKAQVQVTAKREPTWHEDRGPSMGTAAYVPFLRATF